MCFFNDGFLTIWVQLYACLIEESGRSSSTTQHILSVVVTILKDFKKQAFQSILHITVDIIYYALFLFMLLRGNPLLYKINLK